MVIMILLIAIEQHWSFLSFLLTVNGKIFGRTHG